jgi:hypothetical protein
MAIRQSRGRRVDHRQNASCLQAFYFDLRVEDEIECYWAFFPEWKNAGFFPK